MRRSVLAAGLTGLTVAATVAGTAGTANAQESHGSPTSAVATPAGTRVTSTSPGTELVTQAAHSSAARPASEPCGWDGGQMYNHCGNSTLMITVEHIFGSDDHYCVSPGMNNLNAGGDGDNSWTTTYAYYDLGPANCYPGWYQ
jgi:hypothetical protein